MRLIPILVLLSTICPAISQTRGSSAPASLNDISVHDTPGKLMKAWLRFHAMDICQNVVAVFELNKSGMKVWCVIEEEKSYQRFLMLLEPMAASNRIELCATSPPAEKKTSDNENPPPSLWENEELRSYLGNLYSPLKPRSVVANPPIGDMELPSGFSDHDLLRHLLVIYADQILEWNKRMNRYAMDLPALASIASDPDVAMDLRLEANSICMDHSRSLQKYLGKLNANLTPAIPTSRESRRSSSRSQKTGDSGKTLVDKAEQIASTAQGIARNVHNFIYPDNFSVNLEELRQPTLLEAFRELDTMVINFQKALNKSPKE